MASWTQVFSAKDNYSLTLTVTEKSYDIAANTSVVSYQLVMSSSGFAGFSDYRVTGELKIGNSAQSLSTIWSYNAVRAFNVPVKQTYSETLASGTVTINHNNDGTGSAVTTAYVQVADGGDGISPGRAPATGTMGGTLTLTTIPRASTASVSGNFVIGSQKSISITQATTTFKHKITFTVGSKSVTIPASGYITNGNLTFTQTWTPTSADWAAQFPTQTSRSGTMVLYTYNSSNTLIGSNSYTITMQIPDSWKPSVSLSLSPSTQNPWISSKGIYVAGYSKIKATMTGTAATGAAITKYTISGAFSATVTTSSTSATSTSGVISTSGSKSVTVTVTDARGRTGTATASCSFVSYSVPAITAISYARGTYSGGTWTASDTGTDLKVSFTASCSLSGNDNKLSWEIGAPVSTQSSTDLTSGSSVTDYATSIGTTTAYTVVVTVTDKVGNAVSRSVYVPTIEIPFVLDMTKPAIGVGAVPQTARTLELASNWMLNVGAGVVMPYTNDVLASAVAQTGGTIKAYRGSGSAYTGTVPSSYFGYGSFLVFSRATTSIIVIALSSRTSDGIAYNYYNGAWSGWNVLKDRYVDKTHAVTFSAGTIGTRAQSYSWTQSDIGGAPILMQVVDSSGLANFMPICTISGTNAYLNIYRAVASAYSSGSITVRIWY